MEKSSAVKNKIEKIKSIFFDLKAILYLWKINDENQ